MIRSILVLAACTLAAAGNGRIATSFDPGWRFFKGDAPGAEQPDFDDSGWRALNVPHDWSIEGPFDEKNPTGGAGGFLPAGVGWYRKHFFLPEGFTLTSRVFVEFDGVMANSDVWINGQPLGKRPYGYVSFRYELTGKLKAANVLAVRADNGGENREQSVPMSRRLTTHDENGQGRRRIFNNLRPFSEEATCSPTYCSGGPSPVFLFPRFFCPGPPPRAASRTTRETKPAGVAVGEIAVGQRYRKDLGDSRSLAALGRSAFCTRLS